MSPTLMSYAWQKKLCDPEETLPEGKSSNQTSYKRKVKVKVQVTQSCPALCDPMDYTVHGILQAIILEWVAFPFSRGSAQHRDRTPVSHIVGGFFTN